jgi:hypothetical protein
MRRKDEQQLVVFSYISPEQRVPQDHPLRSLRTTTDAPAAATSVQELIRQDWTGLDCPGEVVVSTPAASTVLGAVSQPSAVM